MHKKVTRCVAVLALVSTVFGVTPAMSQTVKANLVLPAMSVLFAPVYIAQDAGYFRDAGVEMELSMLAGPAALNALIGGSGEFTTLAGLIQIRAAQRGQKTLAIAGLQEKATTEIVLSASTAERLAAARSPIDRAKALKGLTLAVDAANGLPHAFLRYVSRQGGLDADRDIRLVFMSPTGMGAALQRKEIDGFVFSSPFTLESVKRGAQMWISGPKGDFPDLDPTAYNVLVARDGYCHSKPSTCKATIAALERAMALVANDPKEALALLSKRFAKMDPDLLKDAFETFRRNTPSRPMPMGQSFNHTVDTMFGPNEDKPALKALVMSLYSDEYLASATK